MADLLVSKLNEIISNVDAEKAVKKVVKLKEKHSDLSEDELVEKLIQKKCISTGTIGFVTSSTSIIPAAGTAFSMTFGVAADISMTFKAHAELVLEIAAVYGSQLTEETTQKIILGITGVSAASSEALKKIGKEVAMKVTAEYAEMAAMRALPVIGVAYSAGTNIVTTYIVGKRAQGYFSVGPENMLDWKDATRALSGIDERKIAEWLKESTSNSFNLVKEASDNTKSSVILSSKKTGTAIILFSKKAAIAIKNIVTLKKDESEGEGDDKSEDDGNGEKRNRPWYSVLGRAGSKGDKHESVDAEVVEASPTLQDEDFDGEGEGEKRGRPWYSVLGRFGSKNDKNKIVESRSTAATINTEVSARETEEAGPKEPHIVGMVGAGNDVTTDLIDEPEKINMVKRVFSWNPEFWGFFDGIKIMPKKNEEEELVVLEDKKEGLFSNIGRIFK